MPYRLANAQYYYTKRMVRIVGLEPTRCHQRQILSLMRLPVPPYPHKPDVRIRTALQGFSGVNGVFNILDCL